MLDKLLYIISGRQLQRNPFRQAPMYAFCAAVSTFSYLRVSTPAAGLVYGAQLKAELAIRKRLIVGWTTHDTCQLISNAVAVVKGCSSPSIV